jgi:hypothetical protein
MDARAQAPRGYGSTAATHRGGPWKPAVPGARTPRAVAPLAARVSQLQRSAGNRAVTAAVARAARGVAAQRDSANGTQARAAGAPSADFLGEGWNAVWKPGRSTRERFALSSRSVNEADGAPELRRQFGGVPTCADKLMATQR